MNHLTWADLCAVKSPEEDKLRANLLKWAENLIKEEIARPTHRAIAALNNQLKSSGTPNNYRLPE